MSAEITEDQVTGQAGGSAEDADPLASVFPGEAVALSSGRVVVVKPWGMRALTKEVPALLGKIMAKVGAIQGALSAGATPEDMVAVLLGKAGEEIMSLVAWSGGLTQDEMDALPAADGLRLMRVVIKQNKAFFGEAVLLYQEFGAELGDSGS